MSEVSRRDRLRHQTARAAELQERDSAALAQSDLPPQPGDLFACRATADFAVEWAVLEGSTGEPSRYRVVPADTFPPIGGGDVAVADDEPCGPLRLRCRHALWVPAAALDPALRSGRLARAVVATASTRVEAVLDGRQVGDAMGREVDSEPDYADWVTRTLLPAQKALGEQVGIGATRDTGATVRAFPSQRPPRRRLTWARGLPLAASLLLAAGLGAGWMWEHRHAQGWRGPAVLTLGRDVVRGAAAESIPPGVGTTLVFIRPPGEPFDDYTLEIRRPEGEVLVRRRGLQPDRDWRVLVGLEPGLLRPGSTQQCLLLGRAGDEETILVEFPLEVDEER
jgi:hypothetical protein